MAERYVPMIDDATVETLEAIRETAPEDAIVNCGSDATPLPEGEKGALRRLQAAGKTPAEAFEILDAMFGLDREPAAELLRRQGLTAAAAREILARTHCRPPESLILAGRQRLGKTPAWLTLAQHDPLAPRGSRRQDPLFHARWHRCRSTSIPSSACWSTGGGA